MPPAASATVDRIVLGYSDAVRSTRAHVLSQVQSTWRGLGDYRDADIKQFVKRVVPVMEGGQRHVASMTDAYLAALETKVLGTPVRPIGIPTDLITTQALRGVPAHEVYTRPGVSVWTALSKGSSLDDAVQQGLTRALSIGATDLQLARTHTTQYALGQNDNVAGYRRVPGGSEVCGLCLVASTQRYHVEDLMPIHPGCSCDVEPIFGDKDPGLVIDPDRLEATHAAIADTFGSSSADARSPVDYRDALIVHDHGEIGPVLAVRGQNFTGPNDF